MYKNRVIWLSIFIKPLLFFSNFGAPLRKLNEFPIKTRPKTGSDRWEYLTNVHSIIKFLENRDTVW